METAGKISDLISEMAEFDMEYFRSYTTMRRLVYADDGAISPATRELLFVVLAAIRNNPGGARTHLRAGAQAGLRLDAVHQALLFVLFELGADAWAHGVSQIWNVAREELPDAEREGPAGPGR